MNRTIVAIVGIGAFVVIAYLGFELLMPTVNRCETIFQQTAPSLTANIKFLETEGGLTLGRTQVQKLTDKAQQVSANLKACCVMVGTGADSDIRFNQCKAATADYDAAISDAVATIKDFAAADDAARTTRLNEIEARLAQIVDTAAAASDSLATQVSEIRESATAPDEPDPANPTAIDEPPRGESSAAPGQLRLRAALTAGGDAVHACFVVYEPKEDLHGIRQPITDLCASNAVFTLPAGDYLATASTGSARREAMLVVQAGAVTDEIIALDAGHLRLRAALIEGGEAVHACFVVYDPQQDLHGNRQPITDLCASNAVFTLPAGDYVATASTGSARREAMLAVRAGAVTDEIIALDAGHLRLRAALIEGGEPVHACFVVYEPEEDLHGNRQAITDLCASNAVFTLPEGRYFVRATSNEATVMEALEIRADAVTDRTLTLVQP